MPRFRLGDRVQLVGDIARFYACIVGVVISDGAYPASVLNQYRVRLADGKEGTFFDFQLETPPANIARVIFDTLVTPKQSGIRGLTPGRHVHLAVRDVDIHLKITGSTKKTILGQVTAGKTTMKKALVTLLIQNHTIATTSTDESGEFTLQDVAPGDVVIEVFIPSRRILAPLSI